MVIGQIGFGILTILCLFAVDYVFFPAHIDFQQKSKFKRNFTITLALWLAVSGGLSVTGFFLNFKGIPPRFVLLVLVPLILFFILFKSKVTRVYLQQISPQRIIALQSFRIPVELLLWHLFISGVLPKNMTFEGYNYDILVGLTAPIMAFFVMKNRVSRWLGILWNVCGLILLLNIVTIAILSAPTQFAYFTNQIPNKAVAIFPIVYLPAILVPMAYYLHFISIRQLLQLNGE